MKYIGSVSPF